MGTPNGKGRTKTASQVGGTRAKESFGMEARALQHDRGKAVILATACIALALWSTSCAGGGSTALVSTAGFSLSSTTVNFGSQLVGTTSPAQTLTLTNNGNAALSITSFAVTGSNAADFAETNTCGSSVAVGATCTISVTFKPSLVGTETASVTITDNASGSPQAVALSGMGTASAASLSATSLTFASQSVGTTSAAQTVTLSSTGSAALSITSVAITGTNAADFAETNTCGSSVAAGANCTISVTFTPAASGSRTASVSITDNGSGSPQTIALSGTGAGPAASLSPTSLAFASQGVATTSAAQTVTLSNTGSAALSIASIAVTGTNILDFTENNACPGSLAAGGNCSITVNFNPTDFDCSTSATYCTTTRTAVLTVTDNNNVAGSTQTLTLTGTASHDVILSWTASATSGVRGYNVYKGTSSGGENLSSPLNGSTPINGTTYTDESVAAGTTYYYVVTAVASDGVTQSADSNEAGATVPPP